MTFMPFRVELAVYLLLVLFSLPLKGETNPISSSNTNDTTWKLTKDLNKPKGAYEMSVGDMAAWAIAAGGIANVVLVIYIFVRSDKAHKFERQEDSKNRE